MTQGKRLDLRYVRNTACLKCDPERRKETIKDELCTQLVSTLDGLPVRCVGEWAYEKIFRLVQYFGIFARGMSKKWRGLNYVEICSGPGRCLNRDDLNEMDGTALAIITHPVFDKLQKAIFIDSNERIVDILNRRINTLKALGKAQAVVGDYSDDTRIIEISRGLPENCLNLCFIDPTQCDVPFSTIRAISTHLKNMDFIINVAQGTDIARNIVQAILDPSYERARSKYVSFLGSEDFFCREDVKTAARLQQHEELRRIFKEEYLENFKKLGFIYSDFKMVRHYYGLLYISHSTVGLDFWVKSCSIGPDDQRELPLD